MVQCKPSVLTMPPMLEFKGNPNTVVTRRCAGQESRSMNRDFTKPCSTACSVAQAALVEIAEPGAYSMWKNLTVILDGTTKRGAGKLGKIGHAKIRQTKNGGLQPTFLTAFAQYEVQTLNEPTQTHIHSNTHVYIDLHIAPTRTTLPTTTNHHRHTDTHR